MTKFAKFGAVCALALSVAGLSLPALAQTVAITGGKVYTQGSAGVLDNGTVLIRDGKIAAVGANVAVPAGAKVIDAKGKIVTPGLISAESGLGAIEVSALGSELAVRNEGLSAAYDVSYGLDPHSFVIPAARLGGLTRAIVIPTPTGGAGAHAHEHDTAGADHADHAEPGLFGGQAAIIHLGGAEGFVMKSKVAMSVDLGAAGARHAGGARGATFVALATMLDDVRHYTRNKARYAAGEGRDLGMSRADLEALIPVVESRMPVVVNVRRASDIQQALRFAREQKLQIILNEADEAWMVASEIAAAKVPVMLNPLSNLPDSFESRAARLDNAAKLHAAGVMVIIKGNEGNIHRAREARYNAGNAVANGLPYGAALDGLTLNPAKAFGVADRIGSLDVGKDADVVVWDGDPFEPMTQPVAVLINGKEQSLMSRGRALADRYKVTGDMPPAYR